MLGHCCSIWAKQLMPGAVGWHPQPVGSRGSSNHLRRLACSTILGLFTQCQKGGSLPFQVKATAVDPDTSAAAASLDDNATQLEVALSPSSTVPCSCLMTAQTWLSGPETSAQLTAAGYDVAALSTKLDAAEQAASAVQQPHVEAAAATAGVSAEAVMQLVQQLCALGAALSAQAISSACNNPACSNISGPSEAALVKGSSSTCGGCRVARYCCKTCRNQHWKQHKPVCKALAAARTGVVP
jgi:hypothetical protein